MTEGSPAPGRTAAPTGEASPAAQAIRARIARQRAIRVATGAPVPEAAPAPSLTPPPAVRVRTATQTLLLDTASLSSVACVLLGLVSVFLAWRGAAATLDIQIQLSFIASGATVGLALVGLGCGLAVVQIDRFVEAQVNNEWNSLAREWAALATAVKQFGEDAQRQEAQDQDYRAVPDPFADATLDLGGTT